MKTTFGFLLAPTLALSFSLVTTGTITVDPDRDHASMELQLGPAVRVRSWCEGYARLRYP